MKKFLLTIGFVVIGTFMLTSWAVAGELELLEPGKLINATEGTYPPFNMVNEKNEMDGFDTDITREIVKRLNLEPIFVPTKWDGIIPSLLADKCDVIISSVGITPGRSEVVNFSQSYYTSGAQLFVRKDSDIKDIYDMADKIIGACTGTTYLQLIIEKKIPCKEVKSYSTDILGLMDLATGRIDGCLTDKVVGFYGIKKSNLPLKAAGPLVFEEKMGIAVKKNKPNLLAAINKALDDMYADGTYEKISKKWFGADIR